METLADPRECPAIGRPRYGWLLVLIALCLCIGSLGFAFPSSGQQNDAQGQGFVLKSDVDLVLLPVSVRDRKGQFVRGLDRSNFQVYENGKTQAISLFRNEDVPVTVGLLVDRSGSMVANQDEVIEGARAFVQNSNANDKEFVVNFGNDVQFALPDEVEFTHNVEQLTDALTMPSASGKTVLYDAVMAALQQIRKDQSGNNRVLLLISDGGDNASRHTFSQALQAAQAANVTIYAIALLDVHSADQNPGVLLKFASETGGKVYFPGSPAEVVDNCRQIAADIRHQYTLGYYPAASDQGGFRKIRVHVSDPGRGKLFVRTRTSYILPSSAGQGAELGK